jgi:dienelactone hydrolase
MRDGVVGTLFLPEGSGPFPGVVVLGGSEGGLSGSETAAVLSGHGFAALALAYFQMPGLPGSLREIPLEYIDGAIAALLDLPAVRKGGVALVGTSKGAEAALLAAGGSERVLAVAALAPSSVVWSCICDDADRSSWSRAGKPVAFVPQGSDPTYRPPPQFPFSPAVNYEYRLRNREAAEKAAIPVERIRGPVFLAAGDRDGVWPSAAMARSIEQRRRRFGCSPQDETYIFAGAGHFIGLPNLPAGSTVVGGRLDAGGTPEANAAASAEMWSRLRAFLSAPRTTPEPCRGAPEPR